MGVAEKPGPGGLGLQCRGDIMGGTAEDAECNPGEAKGDGRTLAQPALLEISERSRRRLSVTAITEGKQAERGSGLIGRKLGAEHIGVAVIPAPFTAHTVAKQPLGFIEFMSNQQDVASFQGPPRDRINFDEQPRYEVFRENLARFATAAKVSVSTHRAASARATARPSGRSR